LLQVYIIIILRFKNLKKRTYLGPQIVFTIEIYYHVHYYYIFIGIKTCGLRQHVNQNIAYQLYKYKGRTAVLMSTMSQFWYF